MSPAQAQHFPWTCEGVTFRSRSHLENSIEQLTTAGSRHHLDAARTLMRLAIQANRLTADQFNDLKVRLHL
jgi:hypothetical protein